MNSNALDRTPSAGSTFTPEQVDLIRRTICVGGTDDELTLFLGVCKQTGLNPFARQIYAIKRKGKMTIQVGIDGYRLIADRTGKYAGNDDTVFDDEKNPQKATVTVYKMVGGVRCAFTASARWSQYYPGKDQGFMWEKMPHVMLGKCAEGLALRKAFPAELSGVYTDAEMEQAGEPEPEPQPQRQPEPQPAKPAPQTPAPAPNSVEADRAVLNVLLKAKHKNWEHCTQWLNAHLKPPKPYTDKTPLAEIAQADRAALITELRALPDKTLNPPSAA